MGLFNKSSNGQVSDKQTMDVLLNQEMQLQGEQNFAAGLGQEDDPIAKWELETRQELEDIRNTFLGREVINGQLTQISTAIINEEGINTLLMPIRAIATKMTSLSNFSEEAIISDCKEFKRSVRKQLIYNCKLWGIEKINRSGIAQTLDTLMNGALNKAKNALLMKIRKQSFITKQLIAGRPNQGGANPNFPI